MKHGRFFNKPEFREYINLLRKLHELIRAGTDETERGEALRERMDVPANSLDQEEIDFANRLSGDFYGLFADNLEPPLPMTDAAQKAVHQALAKRNQRDFSAALDQLRIAAPHFEPWQMNYVRGSTLLEAEMPAIAADYFLDTSIRQPDNPNFRFMWLSALAHASPETALREAQRIIENYPKEDPKLSYKAADILFANTRNLPDNESTDVIRSLVPVFEDAVFRFQLNGTASDEKSLIAAAVTLLGFCHEHLGDDATALRYFNQGVQLYPKHDAPYVARGIQLYGTKTDDAVRDFTKASQLGSPLVWPYFFLAHFHLQRGEIERCMSMATAALQRASIAAVKADCLEWIAICQACLRFPESTVGATFDEALKWSHENPRIVHNRDLFRQETVADISLYRSPSIDELGAIGRQHFTPLAA
ncbi:MAG: hypothetical protein R3C59_16110 [Planctomycetaceae bacterium]